MEESCKGMVKEMSNYYILKFVVSDNDYVAERVNFSNEEINSLKFRGVSLKDKDFRITLKKNRGNVRNTISNLFGFPVVSQVVADVLSEHCPGEIELFEAEVEKKLTSKYYYVNILENLDAIDFHASEYTEIIPGTKVLSEIKKLILDDSKTESRNIFRLKNFKTEIIVSEILKTSLEKLQFSEFQFIATGDFTYEAGRLNQY